MSEFRSADVTAYRDARRLGSALRRELSLPKLAVLVHSTPFLAAVLFVLTLPFASFLPAGGLDNSWAAGLYMALEGGLQFGREFVFTYGPLGFLHVPALYGEGLFVVSVTFTLCVRYLLVASLLWTARRALPLPLALAACYVLLAPGYLGSTTVLVAFLWAFAAVAEDGPPLDDRLLVVGGALLAAIELLGKLNYGISIFTFCVVAIVALPRRRSNLSLFGGVFLVCLLVLWLATGQSIDNLPAYLSNSAQIVSGYSRSMGIDTDSMPHETLFSLLAIATLLSVAAVITWRHRSATRWASLVLLALFCFVCFKQDFIRRGVAGRTDFSLMMAAASIAVATRLPIDWRRARTATAAALIAPMIVFVVWVDPAASFIAELAPTQHMINLQEDLRVVADPALRRSERAAGRRTMISSYSVPTWILNRIDGRSVAIEPSEIGVAWAYGLRWQPLPVIQDYSAYTPALDQLNANALNGRGPETILRRALQGAASPTAEIVNDSYPSWNSPAAKLAVLCNYEEAGSGGAWLLLEKTANRCGPIRPLAIDHSETGSQIDVPPTPNPDEIVFARIEGLGPNLPETAQSLAYRGRNGWVEFDGEHRWGLVTATAADGLIVHAPPDIDLRRPFQLAPDPESFRVGIDGDGSRPITVSFYSRGVEARRAGLIPRASPPN